MFEGLFVLTVIFVAYIVYQIANEKKAGPLATESNAEPVPAPMPSPVSGPETPESASAPAPAAQAVQETVSALQTAPAAESTPSAAAPARTGLRNPATGEVSAPFTNYRFAKRWIKEALVSEGLLDKIYKNNELDAETEAKIKEAVAQMEAMSKYQS